jgi:drug/metabolite transporter (DMT)-like permease
VAIKRAYILLIVSTFLLALNHVIGRAVHEDVPPLGLTFWRWFVAVVFLLPFVIKNARPMAEVFRERWREFFALGALIVSATSLAVIAVNYTTATNVALINATQPAITVLLSWLFFSVELRRIQVLGIIISFAGAITMVSHGDLSVITEMNFNVGDLIALSAMFGFAGYAIRYSRFGHGLPTVSALFLVILCGSLVLLPFYIGESLLYQSVDFNLVTISAIVSIAILVSIGAMLMWNHGNATLGANRASIFINLVPFFGALMGVTLLGERFEMYHFAGMLLICTGVWLVLRTGNRAAPKIK